MAHLEWPSTALSRHKGDTGQARVTCRSSALPRLLPGPSSSIQLGPVEVSPERNRVRRGPKSEEFYFLSLK